MLKGLSTMDMRLIQYSKYYDISIDTDDLEHYCTFITSSLSKIPNHCLSKIFKTINSYLFASLDIKSILELSVPHMNIVYVDDSNEFNFYTLDKIEQKNRYWKQDVNLYNFTESIVANLRSFGVVLFRRIYKDIFKDNIYRSDWKSQNIATEMDCQQIIQNIYFLNNKTECNNIICRIIKNKCIHRDSAEFKDHFNFKSKSNMVLSTSDTVSVTELNQNLFDKH